MNTMKLINIILFTYVGKHMLTAQTNYAGPVHIFAPGENIVSASHR